jgi:hypothetical protein
VVTRGGFVRRGWFAPGRGFKRPRRWRRRCVSRPSEDASCGRGRELARRGCAARNQLCKPISPRRLDAYSESKKCNFTIKVTEWSMGSESEIDQAVASLFFISCRHKLSRLPPRVITFVRDPTRAPSFDVHRPYRICTRVRTPRQQHIHPHISASSTRARPHPNRTRRLRLIIHRQDAR